MPAMKSLLHRPILLALVLIGGCADTESNASASATEVAAPARGTAGDTPTGSLLDGGQPLPAEEVFFPDVFAEADGGLTFGLRMLPHYYVYRDKMVLRSLTDGTTIAVREMPPGRTIEDEWFGEQVVYYNDVLARATLLHAGPRPGEIEVEFSFQGCLEEELCYLPVSRIFSIELPAAVE